MVVASLTTPSRKMRRLSDRAWNSALACVAEPSLVAGALSFSPAVASPARNGGQRGVGKGNPDQIISAEGGRKRRRGYYINMHHCKLHPLERPGSRRSKRSKADLKGLVLNHNAA